MAHLHDEVLGAVKVVIPETVDVSQVYPDDDCQWWVEDIDHNVFAYAWYDVQGELHTKDYRP